jgi:hypothetical protein
VVGPGLAANPPGRVVAPTGEALPLLWLDIGTCGAVTTRWGPISETERIATGWRGLTSGESLRLSAATSGVPGMDVDRGGVGYSSSFWPVDSSGPSSGMDGHALFCEESRDGSIDMSEGWDVVDGCHRVQTGFFTLLVR